MTFNSYTVKKGQLWKNKISGKVFEITARKGPRWKARELTTRQGVYNSTHAFLPHILRQKFELL